MPGHDALHTLDLTAMAQILRSNTLQTPVEIAAVYLRRAFAWVFVSAAITAIVARAMIGGAGWADTIAMTVTVVIIGPVEWVIHRFFLHASATAFVSRRLGTGAGHTRHHLDPTDIDWLMLRGSDATIFTGVFALVTVAWVWPLTTALGVALWGPLVTAWAAAAVSLAHYEWVHLMVHTRYRPRARYYRRLGRNHRQHHYRNEHYWFGITSNLGDRLMGTYPRQPADVPVSGTARTAADRSPSAVGGDDLEHWET